MLDRPRKKRERSLKRLRRQRLMRVKQSGERLPWEGRRKAKAKGKSKVSLHSMVTEAFEHTVLRRSTIFLPQGLEVKLDFMSCFSPAHDNKLFTICLCILV